MDEDLRKEIFGDDWLGQMEYLLAMDAIYLRLTDGTTDPKELANRATILRRLGVEIEEED